MKKRMSQKLFAFLMAFTMILGNVGSGIIVSFAEETEIVVEETKEDIGNLETEDSEETELEVEESTEETEAEETEAEESTEESTEETGAEESTEESTEETEVEESIPGEDILEEDKIVFDAVEIDGTIITVEVINAEFDTDVTFEISLVEKTDEIEALLEEELEKKGQVLSTFQAYDIKLLNVDGDEVEPKAGTLKVSIADFREQELLLEDDMELPEEGVYHLSANYKLKDMKAKRNDDTGELEFITTHFSTFVAYTTGDAQKRIATNEYVNDHMTKWAAEQPEFGQQSEYINQKIEEIAYNASGRFLIHAKDTFTIAEDAEGDLYTFIDLGEAFGKAFALPGGNLRIDLELINNSNHIYRYKEGSYAIAPTAAEEVVEDTMAFNGLPVPAISQSYRIINKAVKDLFPGIKDKVIVSKLGGEEFTNVLAEKGYEGEGAFSRYTLDYYKKDSGAEKLDDLSNEQIATVIPNISTYNGDVLETESEFVELFFNYYENFLFRVSYNGVQPTESSGVNSIGASMRNDNGVRNQAEEIFRSMGTIDKKNETEHEYKGENPIWFHLDGPYTKNPYTITSFSHSIGFALEQVDHNLTINYINLDNGISVGDAYEEIIYIDEKYDVTATANKDFEGFKLVKMEGDALIGTGDTDKVINVYYSSQEPPVVQESYSITVNYYDKNTNTKIADTYTTKQLENSSYNVATQTQLEIEGYTWDSCDNTNTEGELVGNLVFNVYYIKADTPETPGTPDTPDTPDTPSVDRPNRPGGSSSTPEGGPGVTTTIENQDVPLAAIPPIATEIPDGEVPLASLPKTGDTGGKSAIALMASGLLLSVLLLMKKNVTVQRGHLLDRKAGQEASDVHPM